MKQCMLTVTLVMMMLTVVGCSTDLDTSKAQLVAFEKTHASLTRQLTRARQLGMFSKEQIAELDVAIHESKDCLLQWDASINDANVPPPHILDCVTNYLKRMEEVKNEIE